VPSPDPAFADVQVPIASSFLLSSKKGKEAWIAPIVDKAAKTIRYEIRTKGTKDEIAAAKTGTKVGRAAFQCLFSDAPMSGDYIDKHAQAGRMSEVLIAVVAEGKRGRLYVEFDREVHEPALSAATKKLAEMDLSHLEVKSRGTWASNAQGRRYKFFTFKDYFTDRQLVALNTFSDLVHEARVQIEADASGAGLSEDDTPLRDGGKGAQAYAEAVGLYLGLCVGRAANRASSLNFWDQKGENVQQVFARQALPMTWDFVEGNLFSSSTGNFLGQVGYLARAVEGLPASVNGSLKQEDARSVSFLPNAVLSTDPPYYDNIGYADLSDYFYVWLRPALKGIFPEVTAILSTPKANELVASPYRHGGREAAETYFLKGMSEVMSNASNGINDHYPAAIYYAFKASEFSKDGLFSPGWATFIQAVVNSGFSVHGTWPVRSEYTGNLKKNVNALANSVVLVCRKKDEHADTITRAEFIRALKRELPPAIAELQAANIAPADMPQSAIGPGMGVFSRYAAVLESDDSPMSVKTALQLINKELDEFLNQVQGEFDADTRFAITWYEQNGMGKGDYGVADSLARARGIAVDSVKHAGIVESAAGKVRILKRDELESDWAPETDKHLTIWEMLHYLIRLHETSGLSEDTAALLKRYGAQAEAVKDLAYCLYDIAANKRREASEATAYNALIADWTELSRMAASVSLEAASRQLRFEV